MGGRPISRIPFAQRVQCSVYLQTSNLQTSNFILQILKTLFLSEAVVCFCFPTRTRYRSGLA